MLCRESAQVYAGADGIYTGSVYRTAVAKCAAFSLLWTLMCYLFVRSLHLISAVDAVALFATQSNFFYLLSWIILQRNFVALRVRSLDVHACIYIQDGPRRISLLYKINNLPMKLEGLFILSVNSALEYYKVALNVLCVWPNS